MIKTFCGVLVLGMMVACATTSTHVTKIERCRILIDSRYDVRQDSDLVAFMAPYKATVDSIMSPVVGCTARYLEAHRPESDLSNLLADILMWGSGNFGEKPDFAVYNMGGIRAAFPKGNVTFGDVLDVAPFENKICFLTLSGEKVTELFEQMAASGGEGVSHGVKLVITSGGKLKSAFVGGRMVKAENNYRIATLDYLAQGNDGMIAFKDKTDVISPQDTKNNVRFIIQDYFRTFAEKGLVVDSKVEGRVVIE